MSNLRQVAQLAGVSLGTASQALNGKGKVNAETISRVQEAARQLGYQASGQLQRYPTICLLVNYPGADLYLGWTYRLVCSVMDACSSLGYSVLTKQIDLSDIRRSADGFSSLLCGFDGILLYTAHFLELSDEDALRSTNIPLVVMGDSPQGVVSVVIDNRRAAYMATEHLLTLSHCCIVYVSHDSINADDTLRYKGYCDAMTAFGYRSRTFRQDEFILALDCGCIDKSDGSKITAVFCFDDHLAARTLRKAAELGINVPSDLSVIGFGNLPEITSIYPELTTVSQPLSEHAVMASRLLIQKVEKVLTVKAKIEMECSLLVRGTTGHCHTP